MFLSFRRGGLFSRLPKPRALANTLSVSEFEGTIQRERARVDRGGRAFSLALFSSSDRSKSDLPALARILNDRCRQVDVVGRTDACRLGVLMAETTGEGGWAFAEDVLVLLAQAGLRFDCEVYSYPSNWLVPKGGDDEGTDRGEERDTSSDSGLRRLPDSQALAVEARRELNLSAVDTRPVQDLAPMFVHGIPLWKRAMDIAISGLLLILLMPLFLVVALAIKMSSPGPVIFKQPRAGHGGRPFTFYKFRSMILNADAQKEALRAKNEVGGPVFKIKQDQRITPLGRMLRKSSIDELPQLWNVLRGDMSLVGPRPPTLDEVPNYEPWQRQRLTGPVGITCIREVSGRSEVDFEDWVRMDLRYLSRGSFLMDLKLLCRTVSAVLSGRGAW